MAAHGPWFKMFAATLDDTRYEKMARVLGVRLTEVLGCVVKLKCWAIRKRPSGVFDGLDGVDIEIHAGWEGEPGAFAKAALAVGVLGQSRDSIALGEEWLAKEAESYRLAKRKEAQRDGDVSRQSRDNSTEPPPTDDAVPRQSQDSLETVARPESRDQRSEILEPTPPTATNDPRSTDVSLDSPETGGGGDGVRFASKKQLDAAITELLREKASASRIGWDAFKAAEPTEEELLAAVEETRDTDPERIGDPGAFLMGTVNRLRREARLPKRVGTPRQEPMKHEVGDGRL